MRSRQPVTTDQPTNPITMCDHKVRHYHGTNTGYSTCKCRCTDCKDASRRFREDRRRQATRRDPYVQSVGRVSEPPAPSKGLPLLASPIGSAEEAHAAARVISIHAVDATEAREFIHMLGIGPLLQQSQEVSA